MTMESGNISAVRETPDSNGQYGVGVTDGGDFTMTGGKIEAGWFAVAGNGNYKTQNSIINITDGELISTADYAVYLPNPAQRPSVAARFMVPQEVYASNEAL